MKKPSGKTQLCRWVISKSVKIHTFYNIMTRIFEMNNSNGMVCGRWRMGGMKVILMSYGILMFIVCFV